MNTPWGSSQHVEHFAKGFVSVGTAGHGGFMLTEKFAKDNNLSMEALKRGMRSNGYYCYEEDCDYAIPAFELPQYWDVVFKHMDVDPKEFLLETLSMWNADYLEERNIEPEPKAYAFYLKRKQEKQMRAEKHPDLIIAAYGDWETKIPHVIKVCTADDKEYHVTEESYHKRDTIMPLLSKCEIIKAL